MIIIFRNLLKEEEERTRKKETFYKVQVEVKKRNKKKIQISKEKEILEETISEKSHFHKNDLEAKTSHPP